MNVPCPGFDRMSAPSQTTRPRNTVVPTEAEKVPLLETLNAATDEDRREVVEDLFWAILSSREFLFNH